VNDMEGNLLTNITIYDNIKYCLIKNPNTQWELGYNAGIRNALASLKENV